MLCYMVICKAPLTGSYSEALSAWQAGENKSIKNLKFIHTCRLPSRPTVILSKLWLIRQTIGCSPPLFATHATFSACLPPILTRRPGLRKRAHPFTLPLKDDKQCPIWPRVPYRALLPPAQPYIWFPQSVLLYTLYSFHDNYFNLALSSFSAPGSRQLVCIAYYLVLSFLLIYSSSGLSTDVFLIKQI